jgi:putative transposase
VAASSIVGLWTVFATGDPPVFAQQRAHAVTSGDLDLALLRSILRNTDRTAKRGVAMPRRNRVGTGGHVFHVLNRAARKARLFSTHEDYAAFDAVLAESCRRFSMRLLCYVVMPNHWHFVLWPRGDGDLSAFMKWLTQTHAQRWHLAHHTTGTGTLYQGRYKALPIQQDRHLLIVCRYVERNPIRAGLATRSADWRWGSAAILRADAEPSDATGISRPALHAWPVPRPSSWTTLVDAVGRMSGASYVRGAVRTSRPFGRPEWQVRVAAELKWPAGMRPAGRPRKAAASSAGPTIRPSAEDDAIVG